MTTNVDKTRKAIQAQKFRSKKQAKKVSVVHEGSLQQILGSRPSEY